MSVIHKVFTLARTVFCLSLLAISPTLAQGSVYTIEDVEADVTAANAVEAREQAFEEAQITAFDILTDRLLTMSEQGGFEKPDAATISTFVKDFEVSNEQLSAVRYKANYTFRFNPSAIQGYLQNADVPYADANVTKPVLILPYTQRGTRTILWDQNPFMSAWAKARNPVDATQSTTIIPLGDLLDLTQVKDDPALSYDKIMLDRMVDRYDASEAVIAIAEPRPDQTLEVALYSTKTTLPLFLRTIRIPADAGIGMEQKYDRAVTEIRAALKQQWKQDTQIDPALASKLKARAQFSSIQEWIRLKRTIESASGINNLKVQGLKPKEAIMEIEYIGGRDRLDAILSQVGLSLRAPTNANPYNAQLAGDVIYDINFMNRLN